MTSLSEIQKIHKAHWKPGYGSISAKEAMFLQGGIYKRKPKTFLEIGTASGLSTGFIAKFLDNNKNDAKLFSLDLNDTFWGEEGAKTGFLAEKIADGASVPISYLFNVDSTVIPENFADQEIDMAFIDANHQHPWPTLDMLSLMPFVKSKALIYHHDLALYTQQVPVFGIGPKYLFDQIPHQLRVATPEPKRNIYYIIAPENYRAFSESLIKSLFLPWTIRRKLTEDTLNRFRAIIKKYWNEEILTAFNKTSSIYNK